MRAEKLTLDHKQLLHDRLKQSGTFLSEYSFANLYLFRQRHEYPLLQAHGEIFIAGKTYDGYRFVMPARDPRPGPADTLLKVAAGYDFIFPVPEEWLEAFPPREFRWKFHDGDSDYIYEREKISTYRGQKLHGKKNLLNQFLRLYTPRPEPLTAERMEDAARILDAWQEEAKDPKEETDYFPCREALKLYDTLVLCGGIYYVGDDPAGFVIGEELNDTSFVLHFVKGRRQYKGIYQYMYNHFAGILPSKYLHLNFEQDLGKMPLKLAKASYAPDRTLKKYRVSLKHNIT